MMLSFLAFATSSWCNNDVPGKAEPTRPSEAVEDTKDSSEEAKKLKKDEPKKKPQWFQEDEVKFKSSEKCYSSFLLKAKV